MTDTVTLKTELGRIRGAIMSGSFDRDTALDALDKAEKALDAKAPTPTSAPAAPPVAPAKLFAGNPVPEQVGKPFVPGGTVQAPPHTPSTPGSTF